MKWEIRFDPRRQLVSNIGLPVRTMPVEKKAPCNLTPPPLDKNASISELCPIENN
jgi:hypothetical protein